VIRRYGRSKMKTKRLNGVELVRETAFDGVSDGFLYDYAAPSCLHVERRNVRYTGRGSYATQRAPIVYIHIVQCHSGYHMYFYCHIFILHSLRLLYVSALLTAKK
jgi:hypothetical protein